MVAPRGFFPDGEDIVDEPVLCSELVTINGTDYYVGYLWQIANELIAGNTHATYGIWSAVLEGGTRYDVLLAGPGVAEGNEQFPDTTSEASLDIQNGLIYLTDDSIRTVFVTYRAHGPIRRSPIDLMINMDYVLTAGEAIEAHRDADTVARLYTRWKLYLRGNSQVPDALAYVRVKNEDAGGDERLIPISATGSASAALWLTPFKVMQNQELIVETDDGLNALGAVLELFGD